uniref:Uncharacterized protein n=1 Tax=Panagrolaimus sp. JU765 TaxID=591449 RepID=A0AC34QKL7_9BILA
MSSRKKNLLAGGPKRSAATTSASSLSTTLRASASSSSDSQQSSLLQTFSRTSLRQKKSTASTSDAIVVEPPAKKQKSNSIITPVRSSPRKLSGTQNNSSPSKAQQPPSPSKRRHKERPTTPVPEHAAKESKLSGAVVTKMLDNSIPEEDDGIEVDSETRIAKKRRPSRVMVDEALIQVKKMKIATPAIDEIDPNCTANLRSQQSLGKTFKKQRRINSGVPTQRISSQQMILFPKQQ